MSNLFFEHPILNSPYQPPIRHWELDDHGQPTQQIKEARRRAEFITPIPKPRKRKGTHNQQQIIFDEGKGLSSAKQQYDPTSIINELRQQVDQWRKLPNPNSWQVTPETVRLLQHWRHHPYNDIRPFFCQVEAVETAIWLTEVAPQAGKSAHRILEHLANANKEANPELMRLALKLATGAGKTTVMAMLIAWQTINSVRRPASKHFTRGFLVCTPGLTIKDRLRVLQPNDPDAYYAARELVPEDMRDDIFRAKIVITNFHAFKLRERLDLSAGGRSLPRSLTAGNAPVVSFLPRLFAFLGFVLEFGWEQKRESRFTFLDRFKQAADFIMGGHQGDSAPLMSAAGVRLGLQLQDDHRRIVPWKALIIGGDVDSDDFVIGLVVCGGHGCVCWVRQGCLFAGREEAVLLLPKLAVAETNRRLAAPGG